jgi:Uma2 family endonuclease
VTTTKTVILGPPPPEVEALIKKRQKLGHDRFDEVWEGDYHMVPGPRGEHADIDVQLIVMLAPYAKAAGLVGSTIFNVGEDENNFRVPDGGYHRGRPTGVWLPTAAIVVEVLSPHDETYEKFPFYAAHKVDEILVVDPDMRTVRCFVLRGKGYAETVDSELLGIRAEEITARIDWP